MPQKIVIVGSAAELLSESLFSRETVEVIQVPNGDAAMAVARRLPIDLLVLPGRMPGLALQRFVDNVREEDSESRECRIAVLADEKSPRAVRRVRDDGLVVFEAKEGSARLGWSVDSLLRGSLRAHSRVMVNINVALGEADTVSRMCQTVNISEGGMLIKSSQLLPLGTRASFELALPEDGTSIRGAAEVVRHTDLSAEGLRGMALQFTGLRSRSEEKLRGFLRTKATLDEPAFSQAG